MMKLAPLASGRLASAVFAAAIGLHAASAAEITDQRGRTHAFDAPAKRVVLIPMPAPSMFIAVDGTESHIVGMHPAAATAMGTGPLGSWFPGVGRIATNIVEGNSFIPNVESILALEPDAVFQWTTAGANALDLLDKAGLTVFGMRYGTQTDLAGDFEMMGAVAGQAERAAEINRRQHETQASLETLLGGLRDDQRPRVLYLNRASQSLTVGGKKSYIDFSIHLAGGANVAKDIPGANNTVTIEQILTWNPDVVLLGNFDTVEPADLYRDPKWQDVKAVKEHRVYRMPLGGYRWDPPSQESALSWLWLARLLHPNRETANLPAAMKDWYGFLYHRTLSDGEIASILFLSKNRGSAGYKDFARL